MKKHLIPCLTIKKKLDYYVIRDVSNLLLIYVNNLPSCLETVRRFFADDTALLIDNKNTTELQTLIQKLANIYQWMTANNLVVNANKAIALNIPPYMRNNNATLSYVLNGKTVRSSNSEKYLGTTIDNQLSFKTRINNLESKIARSVGVIAKLNYYLPHNTLLKAVNHPANSGGLQSLKLNYNV